MEFGKDEVLDELLHQAAADLGNELKKVTPPGYGFIGLIAKLGDGGGVFYVANVERESAIRLMKEFIGGV